MKWEPGDRRRRAVSWDAWSEMIDAQVGEQSHLVATMGTRVSV